MSVCAGTEASGDKSSAAEADASAEGGDEDLEGQLWEQQQQLEEVSALVTSLQDKVCRRTTRTRRLAAAGCKSDSRTPYGLKFERTTTGGGPG